MIKTQLLFDWIDRAIDGYLKQNGQPPEYLYVNYPMLNAFNCAAFERFGPFFKTADKSGITVYRGIPIHVEQLTVAIHHFSRSGAGLDAIGLTIPEFQIAAFVVCDGKRPCIVTGVFLSHKEWREIKGEI